MQITKKLTIAEALHGSEISDNMPLGWLSTFVQRVQKTAEGMQLGEIHVRGAAGMYAEWQHTLTREEEVQARLEAAVNKLAQISFLLPLDGKAMTAEQVVELRKILG